MPLVATHLSIFISFSSLRGKNLKLKIVGNVFQLYILHSRGYVVILQFYILLKNEALEQVAKEL